jgi:hypothetical protein
VVPAQLVRLCPGLLLPQHPDDLRLAEAASLHRPFPRDPRPENQPSDKLSEGLAPWFSAARTGGLEGGEVGLHGGTDTACIALGGRWHEGERDLSRARDQRRHLVHLEEEVTQVWA